MPVPPPANPDLDGDGWSPPEDCDDSDPQVHPDAVDVPYNGVDEDCSGADLVDVDQDGHDALEAGGDDCNDANGAISPSSAESCGQSADEDCDGEIDEGCVAAADPGDPGGFAWACTAAPGAVPPWLLLVVLLPVLTRSSASRWLRSGSLR